MPWVDGMVAIIEMKSSNWIAPEARSQAANGNKLEICKLPELDTCLLHYQNLMISVIDQFPFNFDLIFNVLYFKFS